MFMSIKRDFIFALALAASILGYGFCGDAQAQTTQPVYVRPSKGSLLTVITNATATTSSPVLDFTSFESMQITPNILGMCTGVIIVTGSTSKTGPFLGLTDPFATQAISLNTYTVENIPPFAQVTFQTSPGGCPGGISVSIVPLPFSQLNRVQGSYVDGQQVTSNLIYPVTVGGIAYGSGTPTFRPVRLDSLGRVTTGVAQSGLGSASFSLVLSPTQITGGGGFTCAITVINTGLNLATCAGNSGGGGVPINPSAVAGQAGGSFTFNYGGEIWCNAPSGNTTVVTLRTPCN